VLVGAAVTGKPSGADDVTAWVTTGKSWAAVWVGAGAGTTAGGVGEVVLTTDGFADGLKVGRFAFPKPSTAVPPWPADGSPAFGPM